MRLFHKNLGLGLLLESQIWQFWVWIPHGNSLLQQSSNSPCQCFLISHSSHRLSLNQVTFLITARTFFEERTILFLIVCLRCLSHSCLSHSRHFRNKYLQTAQSTIGSSPPISEMSRISESLYRHTISYNHTICTGLMLAVLALLVILFHCLLKGWPESLSLLPNSEVPNSTTVKRQALKW